MDFNKIGLLILISSLSATFICSDGFGNYTIFDFTQEGGAGIEEWSEQSDTVRAVGMSKAVLAIHNNTDYRRAIFFSLLNVQPDGSAFAGMRALGNYNLTGSTQLMISCRGQGQFNGFKVVLRHKGLNDEPNNSYEQFFYAPQNEFGVVTLPFSDFSPYYRGQLLNESEPLDLTWISSIGIQAYGGVYLPVKQNGTASLEIDWIKASTA